jgi:hypothetical protein
MCASKAILTAGYNYWFSEAAQPAPAGASLSIAPQAARNGALQTRGPRCLNPPPPGPRVSCRSVHPAPDAGPLRLDLRQGRHHRALAPNQQQALAAQAHGGRVVAWRKSGTHLCAAGRRPPKPPPFAGRGSPLKAAGVFFRTLRRGVLLATRKRPGANISTPTSFTITKCRPPSGRKSPAASGRPSNTKTPPTRTSTTVVVFKPSIRGSGSSAAVGGPERKVRRKFSVTETYTVT